MPARTPWSDLILGRGCEWTVLLSAVYTRSRWPSLECDPGMACWIHTAAARHATNATEQLQREASSESGRLLWRLLMARGIIEAARITNASLYGTLHVRGNSAAGYCSLPISDSVLLHMSCDRIAHWLTIIWRRTALQS